MKEYYLFKINNEYEKLTRHNPFNLYMVLSGIKRSSVKDIGTAFSLFDSICDLIDKNELLNVLGDIKKSDCFTVYNNTYSYNDYFNKETTRIFFHKSYIKIITNKEKSLVFKRLSKLKNAFMIDFINKKYFWLEKVEIKELV